MNIMDISSNNLYNSYSNYLLEPQSDKERKDGDKKNLDNNELDSNEQMLVQELQDRDTEVRAHEAAHQAAGGGMTGAASFTYQQGPDGKMYAIGGEVSISMKTGSTPQETIANARKIIAAAMAPGNPSSQDHAVASSAKVMEMKALQQLAKEEQEEASGKDVYKNQDQSMQNDENSDAKIFDISA
jgi:hypothetical protein